MKKKAKLYFYYSTMNAGKTTSLLQTNNNYKKRNFNTLIFIPKTANTNGIIKSRIGIYEQGKTINTNFNIFNYIKRYNNPKIDIIFIDEVHFLNKKQIFQIISIVDHINIPVLTYGLRTDFQSKLFESSKYLLALADKVIEIKTICYCGNKAIMNLRLNEQGHKTFKGNQINTDKTLYTALCRKHFYKYKK